MLSQNKSVFRRYCEAMQTGGKAQAVDAARAFFSDNATINVVHPLNALNGVDSFTSNFIDALYEAFDHLRRSDYIAFGGEFEGAQWVTSTGYYSGHFSKDFLGIAPTGTVANLRFGEFHKMQNGQAIESYIYLDLPELMIAANQWPITHSPGNHRGYTGYLPGPITQDGLQWHENDPKRGPASAEMVTKMLRGLATKNEAWRPYWHNDMRWYGPAAFGSFFGLDEFAGFQVPFENAFSEWIGGSLEGSQTHHFARFGDGNYICSGGWPSLNAVQAKTFLGQPSEGKRLYMRVCDWWRREGDLLIENWVFVDIPHVLLQMGYDVFANIPKAANT